MTVVIDISTNCAREKPFFILCLGDQISERLKLRNWLRNVKTMWAGLITEEDELRNQELWVKSCLVLWGLNKFVIARKVNMARSQRVNLVSKLTRPEHECVSQEK